MFVLARRFSRLEEKYWWGIFLRLEEEFWRGAFETRNEMREEKCVGQIADEQREECFSFHASFLRESKFGVKNFLPSRILVLTLTFYSICLSQLS